ncbi:hypothetical protein Alches_17540 [Alicyclobacillus hesperidum subsp. aegles]|nr:MULTISPECIES: hypothetical protein [Alicyclobacillus]GLG01714.1 hypothetical protein Alches_17540 [Alicyclobacillus hesperidum subsp. aegles]
MTTQTKASLEKTVSTLTEKLANEKMAHIATILNGKYELKMYDYFMGLNENSCYVMFTSEKIDRSILVTKKYELDEMIECDAECEALNLWNLWVECGKEIFEIEFLGKELTTVSSNDEAVDSFLKFLQEN